MKKIYNRLLKGISILVLLLVSNLVKATTIVANSIGSLPSVLVESSGVDFDGNGHFWSQDDSGTPTLYEIGTNAALIRTVTISNSHVRNWEDLTHDSARNFMFIGDFGNNNDDRTNLRIFKIPYPSNTTSNTIPAQEIDYTYPDQHHFPSTWLNFDVESFFHYHGQLFLFTKTDGNAIGYTKMYTLPDVPGTYVATLVDSFYTNDRTTSADISPDGSSVVLISNTHIHLFRNFTGTNFFGGQHTQINIAGGWTQKEGVSFSSDHEIYMTDENSGSGNHLYYVDLAAWIPVTPVINTSIESIGQSSIQIYPMPANDFVNIMLKNLSSDNIKFSLYDLTGKLVYESRIDNLTIPYQIRTADFREGVYFYSIFADDRAILTSRLIINH